MGRHSSEFGVLALVGLAHVGDGVVVGDRCACDLGNVVLDFVANVGHVVGAVVVVACCSAAAAVLDVRVVSLDLHFKVIFGSRVVGLGSYGLLFPFHHLGLVKKVGAVHFLQIELELVLIRYGDVGSHKGGLVVFETLSEGG